ncbi:MAG: peptide deformylase [Ruminococcus sp.]|nr:peptide deformylase [Ruminococcus sp.]
MVKPIVKDVFFLGKKCEPATQDDMHIVKDLQDTLVAHRENCAGLAANMIGYNKKIVIIDMGYVDMIMINPKITKKNRPYLTDEGCLSLEGLRKVTRYEEIEVEFYNAKFEKQLRVFKAYFAEIIQHEIDHCEGIVV